MDIEYKIQTKKFTKKRIVSLKSLNGMNKKKITKMNQTGLYSTADTKYQKKKK